MNVLDLNGKPRRIQSIQKILHTVPNAIHSGERVGIEFVEVIIQGKTRTWKEWWPLDAFMKLNPEVEI